MLSKNRENLKNLSESIGRFLSRLPMSPNGYTLLSLILAVLSFYFIVRKTFFLAIFFFVLAAMMDFVDGAVARFSGKVTKIGAYLDTILDRYVESIILGGFLFLTLPEILVPSYVWITLAILGSLMTTYSKAAAREKELTSGELKGGIFERTERLIFIFIALLATLFKPEFSIYPLIILAIFSNLSALQRVHLVLKLQSR